MADLWTILQAFVFVPQSARVRVLWCLSSIDFSQTSRKTLNTSIGGLRRATIHGSHGHIARVHQEMLEVGAKEIAHPREVLDIGWGTG